MHPQLKIGLLIAAIMSFCMAAFFTGLFSWIVLGFSTTWLFAWARGFAMAWPLAFVMAFILGRLIPPMVIRWVTKD